MSRMTLRPCPACWTVNMRRTGLHLCRNCWTVVERSCRGKKWLRTRGYAKLSATRLGNHVGRRLESYQCAICEAWHVGGCIPPGRAKRVRFVSNLLVGIVPAEQLQRIRQQWQPEAQEAA